RRLRILHVVHKLDYGGLERLVGALVERLPRDRFENHILTLSDFGRFAEGLAGHAQLHQERSLRRWSMIWPRGLTRTIRALAPDVVHSHRDRKSTRLNSSHVAISYAVFCLKKKNKTKNKITKKAE